MADVTGGTASHTRASPYGSPSRRGALSVVTVPTGRDSGIDAEHQAVRQALTRPCVEGRQWCTGGAVQALAFGHG
ncbi:hypothetical protein GCM10009801_08560 [Streptomyces albiaxialis]|uniref:Transposase n=1 Tax=Streptomyces albiaxialis TaxID=329523 RepID=A0ABN2VJR8_9ACTN